MAAIADSKGEVKWKCPITGECSTSKLHRRCNGDDCGKFNPEAHCYDCCSACQANCQKPPEPIDYDLPEGETW